MFFKYEVSGITTRIFCYASEFLFRFSKRISTYFVFMNLLKNGASAFGLTFDGSSKPVMAQYMEADIIAIRAPNARNEWKIIELYFWGMPGSLT